MKGANGSIAAKVKRWRHIVLLSPRQPQRAGQRWPLADDLLETLNNSFRICSADSKVLGHFASKLKIQSVISICDVQLQPICVCYRVHIVCIRQAPSPTGVEDEAMIAQVIVGIGNQNVEHNARP